MAEVSGTVCGVRRGSTIIAGTGTWRLSFAATNAEITAFGDAARKRSPVIKDASGTFSGYYDYSDAQQAGLLDQFKQGGSLAKQDIRLYEGASSYWYGSIVIDGADIDANFDDVVRVDFAFSAAGEIYHT